MLSAILLLAAITATTCYVCSAQPQTLDWNGKVGEQQIHSQDRSADWNLQDAAQNSTRTAQSNMRSINAQLGQSVLLHCPLDADSQSSVSWFRGSGELQLLTYETSTVIQDDRFVVRHGLLKDHDWALQIKNVDKSDAGLYQCQTSSAPPLSQYYQLNVVEPQVNILGGPDLAVRLGSTINLTCIISQSADQLQYIFWYRDERMINYDMNERGKIVISKSTLKLDTIESNLQIFNSKLSDAGNYTCQPSGARAKSIHVHVLEGSDRRLIMFQNDFEPANAESQQSNSALSLHVSRLSRARIYALFAAFLVFAGWFQLLAQFQTLVSLFLLAVIGFFLGKVTDQQSDVDHLKSDHAKHLRWAHLEDKCSELAKRNQPHDNRKAPSSAGPSSELASEQNGKVPLDSHLVSAQSALELLRRLSTSATDSQSDEEANADSAKSKSTNRWRLQLAPKQPLNSPSGQSNSSSNSTGYNSDTRSADPTSPAQLAKSRPTKIEVENCTMIELVREPTALSLLMDQFAPDNRTSSECLYSQPSVAVSQQQLANSPSCSSTSATCDRPHETAKSRDELR